MAMNMSATRLSASYASREASLQSGRPMFDAGAQPRMSRPARALSMRQGAASGSTTTISAARPIGRGYAPPPRRPDRRRQPDAAHAWASALDPRRNRRIPQRNPSNPPSPRSAPRHTLPTIRPREAANRSPRRGAPLPATLSSYEPAKRITSPPLLTMRSAKVSRTPDVTTIFERDEKILAPAQRRDRDCRRSRL